MAKTMVVLKLDIAGDGDKRKVMKIVSSFSGIDSIKIESDAKKLTVICGYADPIKLVSKVRKHYDANVISIAPVKEEKKEEKKPEQKKKEEGEKKMVYIPQVGAGYYGYYTPPPPYAYYAQQQQQQQRVEEDPNPCNTM